MEMTITNVKTIQELDKVLAFQEKVFSEPAFVNSDEYARDKWLARIPDCGELMLYAEDDVEVIAMAFGRIEANGNLTVGPVASDPRYRKHGLARMLIYELEKRAQVRGIHLLVLGAVESAEGFYLKCGYNPLLFIQSKPPHTLEAFSAFNTKYCEVWKYDDGKDIRLLLMTNGIDRKLQHEYDQAFPGCSTQVVFTKNI